MIEDHNFAQEFFFESTNPPIKDTDPSSLYPYNKQGSQFDLRRIEASVLIFYMLKCRIFLIFFPSEDASEFTSLFQ